MHDISRLGIPDRILLKPEPLTDEKWAVMRRLQKRWTYLIAITRNGMAAATLVV